MTIEPFPTLFQEEDGKFIHPLIQVLLDGGKLSEVRVVDQYMDDHQPCVDVWARVAGVEYKYAAMWLGNEELRLHYQAEVNQKLRDKLAKFIREYCQE